MLGGGHGPPYTIPPFNVIFALFALHKSCLAHQGVLCGVGADHAAEVAEVSGADLADVEEGIHAEGGEPVEEEALGHLLAYERRHLGQELGRGVHWGYTTLHYTEQHYTTLHYTEQHYTTLHYTTRSNTTLHYNTLYGATLHYTTLHGATLHYSTLLLTTLYNTTLHYISLTLTLLNHTTLYLTILHSVGSV